MSVSEKGATSGYIVPLVEAMRASAKVDYFTWRRALFGRYAVFHSHWPEFLVRDNRRIVRAVKNLLFRALITRVRLARVAAVRTIHNQEPHEEGKGSEQRLLHRLERATVGWIVLNRSTEVSSRREVIEIPHGHYTHLFDPDVIKCDRRLVFFGALRAYKGIESLLESFSNLDDPRMSLHLTGASASKEIRQLIIDGALADPRVTVNFGFLSDRDLASEVGRSSLAVLPYRQILNSGSAIFAASVGTPVLLPRNDATVELRESLGDEWVYLYEGELSAKKITDALEVVAYDRPKTAPEWPERDWSAVAARHKEFYRKLVKA